MPHPLTCKSTACTTHPGRPPPEPAKPAGPQEHPPRPGTPKCEHPGEAPRRAPPHPSPQTGHSPAVPHSPRRRKDSSPGPAAHRTAQATRQCHPLAHKPPAAATAGRRHSNGTHPVRNSSPQPRAPRTHPPGVARHQPGRRGAHVPIRASTGPQGTMIQRPLQGGGPSPPDKTGPYQPPKQGNPTTHQPISRRTQAPPARPRHPTLSAASRAPPPHGGHPRPPKLIHETPPRRQHSPEDGGPQATSPTPPNAARCYTEPQPVPGRMAGERAPERPTQRPTPGTFAIIFNMCL
ncbi:proline-rich protein 2-like [Gouania willdenowi]|uniref:proline-rich protein 2-like n=1 Tax=Gouania willdenowi TaxID=441366 RepID=UPI0010542802|nr:proline-rich protein 2-like [Gouania willdenowi]